MKRVFLTAVASLGLVVLATVAHADPPPGVGSANVFKDAATCGFGFIDVGGQSYPFFPGGEGIVGVPLDDAILVETNDANGHLKLSCHGMIPLGEDIVTIDLITGEEIVATLATVEEACNAIRETFPEACRGKSGAITFTYETTTDVCNIGGYLTTDWIIVVTRPGRAHLSCLYKP